MSVVPESHPVKSFDVLEYSSLSSESNQHSLTIRRLLDGESGIDSWLVRASDWCSPILVKETRQSLKSRQFQWTFMLLMLAIASWTLFAVLTSIPEIYFAPAGKYLLTGYVFLLIIPACVVVPNAAYRSMANELEQGTFDVLTLSPLSSFQIVIGKLAVACAQNVFYFAALTPCFALTYLLRGVTWGTILLSLAAIATCSLVEIALGLLMGSLDRKKRYSTLISIGMIIVTLGSAFFIYATTTSGLWAMTVGSDRTSQIWMYSGVIVLMIFIGSYVVLLVLAASAVTGMASENYSTTIRWWSLFQSILLLGVFGGILSAAMLSLGSSGTRISMNSRDLDILQNTLFVALGIHWSIVGIFFVSERGVITPRSRRRLPSSLLQRVFLSWGNPGSGTGYVFVLLSLSSGMTSAFVLGDWIVNISGIATTTFASSAYFESSFVTAIMIFGWVAFYLGLVRLTLVLFARKLENRMVLGITLLILYLFAAASLTLFISSIGSPTNTPSYEWYSIANIPWSATKFDRMSVLGAFEALVLASGLVVACNFVTLSRDLVIVRLNKPSRVRQEHAKVEPVDESPDPFG